MAEAGLQHLGVDVFQTQRQLRSELLDGNAIRHKAARDLAAHLLLNLDDLNTCWAIATNWLLSELRCDRVDTGFGAATSREYFPGYAEAKNAYYDIPSFGGSAVFNFDPLMQAMWHGAKPVAFVDIKHDRRVTPYLRQRMASANTKSKFGTALRGNKGSFGLICADWTLHPAPNESGLFDCFEYTVADVLGPIISAARSFSSTGGTPNSESDDHLKQDGPAAGAGSEIRLAMLTESELEVARLVAQGMSYKEIARIRDRSFSTIDHQLRSIRQKTGVSSTAALVSFLARIDALH
ncbi:MAG: LuxR C-terminal-related transcriptional regulator [Rhizobium sp.]|nr:LuxR C-terminal-related transcriptional regulator [Rhizobium sp.]